MKRVVKVTDSLNERKYILKEEYGGFGIYEEKTPTGFFVHQSWLIRFESPITVYNIVIQSYNSLCKEELYDIIDNYNEKGEFGIKVLDDRWGNDEPTRYMHPSGRVI